MPKSPGARRVFKKRSPDGVALQDASMQQPQRDGLLERRQRRTISRCDRSFMEPVQNPGRPDRKSIDSTLAHAIKLVTRNDVSLDQQIFHRNVSFPSLNEQK